MNDVFDRDLILAESCANSVTLNYLLNKYKALRDLSFREEHLRIIILAPFCSAVKPQTVGKFYPTPPLPQRNQASTGTKVIIIANQ